MQILNVVRFQHNSVQQRIRRSPIQRAAQHLCRVYSIVTIITKFIFAPRQLCGQLDRFAIKLRLLGVIRLSTVRTVMEISDYPVLRGGAKQLPTPVGQEDRPMQNCQSGGVLHILRDGRELVIRFFDHIQEQNTAGCLQTVLTQISQSTLQPCDDLRAVHVLVWRNFP